MPRMNAINFFALSFAAGLASFGCSFQAKEGAGTGGGSLPPGFDAAPADRVYTTSDTGAANGDACPAHSFNADNLPPDLLIVLDRSGSMNEDPLGATCQGGCGANSKWTLMTAAINQVVSQSEAKVNWGLKFFGTGTNGCTVADGAAVAPAPMTAAAVAAAIAAPRNQPATSTPTRAAVASAGRYLGTLTDANPKFILLATDGEPNCAAMGGGQASDAPGAIQAVTAVAGMGFPTFVIGIAADGVAGTTLDSMAMAGGRPRAGTPLYYSVSSTADLAAALTAIQSMVALPCQFQLGGVPSDPAAVSVSVEGVVVPMSEWTYGPGMRSIIFPDSGARCAMLKSGSVKNVVINLPCGVTII